MLDCARAVVLRSMRPGVRRYRGEDRKFEGAPTSSVHGGCLPSWIHDRRDSWPAPLRTRSAPVERLLIHRVGGPAFSEDVTALVPQLLPYWGGLVAYGYLVDRRGWVFCLTDDRIITPHAWKQNGHAIGVGFVGDFRQQKPEPLQFAGGVLLLTWLLQKYPNALIGGHTNTPNATRSKGKECPGTLFGMDAFLEVVWRERVHSIRRDPR